MEVKKALDIALKKCNGEIIPIQVNEFDFSYLYNFATEAIALYKSFFDLNNKSLLTVGSSCDQVIEAYAAGASKVRVVDINYFTKYYFYLKKAALLTLTLDDYLNYLSYNRTGYKATNGTNSDILSVNLFEKIKPCLKSLNNDAYVFWTKLYDSFSGKEIFEKMFFTFQELTDDEKRKCITYLSSNKEYKNAREKIKDKDPFFNCSNLMQYNARYYYDNIWLSNVLEYLSLFECNHITQKVVNCTRDNGKALICYLFAPGFKGSLEHIESKYNLEAIDITGYHAVDQQQVLIYTKRGNTNNKK